MEEVVLTDWRSNGRKQVYATKRQHPEIVQQRQQSILSTLIIEYQ